MLESYPSSRAPCAEANCRASASASARGTLNSTEASGNAWKKYLYATPAPTRPARIQIRSTRASFASSRSSDKHASLEINAKTCRISSRKSQPLKRRATANPYELYVWCSPGLQTRGLSAPFEKTSSETYGDN